MNDSARTTPTLAPPAVHASATAAALEGGTVSTRTHGTAATAMLTTYMVLLYAIPSNLQWSPLGSLGKPSTVFGIGLLGWWLLTRWNARTRPRAVRRSPVMTFFLAFCVVILVSYAAALLRGQPSDQVGSITTSLVRIASLGGVLVAASHGIRTRAEMVLVFRRLTITASILAALGYAQLFTGSTLVGWVSSLPGLAVEWGGTMDTKGGLLRAVGTSTHPLEFSSSMTALLPITLAYAALARHQQVRHPWRRYVPPAAVLALLVLTVSRSAIIGIVIALLIVMPFLPRAFRKVFLTVGVLGAGALTVAYPRVILTTLWSFTGVAEDPSALSRTTALSRVPEFAWSSPWYGAGLGAFLPRYYIFDNAWALMLIEAGLLGVCAFLLMLLSGAVGSLRTAMRSTDVEGRALAGALASAVTTTAVLMAMFDGLSFTIFAGTLFLVLGLGVAVRRVEASSTVASGTVASGTPASALPR
ncbi:hypothetical protein ET495_00080 [Xylanimonas allomyrinae]|uniref:O-antigen ligase domain-containing protein n=1 Tax=Xylanimonas allomyrinae TaxID=2509459 RepID=A0A4P6EK06_9MICO|nr:O-antigen ligase family protein [Xylanimonas allomyrinae]QAY61963.1 hypothetical protein ET495_00080 [Xylanimonas allomyrinae]